MPKFLTLEEAYSSCHEKGYLIPKDKTDVKMIKTILKIADETLDSARDDLVKKRFNSAYKNYYDVLHELVEAFLSFDRIKSSNHQCLFAYLCMKHPELELSWDFFEKFRTKRNGIHYYGTPVTYEDWKMVEIQINLYINLLKKKILEWIK